MLSKIGKLCARKKIPLLKPGSVFKDHVHRLQTLEKRLEDLDSLSINSWLIKFVQEVANKTSGHYSPCCGLKRHLEDKHGGKALDPLDSRYFARSFTLVQCALHDIECL